MRKRRRQFLRVFVVLCVVLVIHVVLFSMSGCARPKFEIQPVPTHMPMPTPVPANQIGPLSVNGQEIGRLYDPEYDVVCYYYYADVTKHEFETMFDFEFDFELSCVRAGDGDR